MGLVHRVFSSRLGAAFAGAVAMAAVGSVAWAAVPDNNGAVHGCYSPRLARQAGAPLRVIDSAQTSCLPGQTELLLGSTGSGGGGIVDYDISTTVAKDGNWNTVVSAQFTPDEDTLYAVSLNVSPANLTLSYAGCTLADRVTQNGVSGGALGDYFFAGWRSAAWLPPSYNSGAPLFVVGPFAPGTPQQTYAYEYKFDEISSGSCTGTVDITGGWLLTVEAIPLP